LASWTSKCLLELKPDFAPAPHTFLSGSGRWKSATSTKGGGRRKNANNLKKKKERKKEKAMGKKKQRKLGDLSRTPSPRPLKKPKAM
jgi:hypothetical protein